MCQPCQVTDGSKKAIIAAFFANLGIAIAKFIGYLITRSAGMLAESVHSFADTGNQGLLLLGGNRAKRDATPEHPFGYGRERYFWSFAVALVLFSMGGLFALYEGINKFRHPHEVSSIWVAVSILVFGLLIEGYSLRTAIKEAQHIKGRLVGPKNVEILVVDRDRVINGVEAVLPHQARRTPLTGLILFVHCSMCGFCI